jgi:predicted DsbA family dithiol-disulfide isomerase
MSNRRIVLSGCLIAILTPLVQAHGRKFGQPLILKSSPRHGSGSARSDSAQQREGQNALAILNGQTITQNDLPEGVRSAIEQLSAQMDAQSKAMLENLINSMLLQTEGQKRRLTVEQLIDVEVIKKIPAPTDSEIQDFIKRHTKDPFEDLLKDWKKQCPSVPVTLEDLKVLYKEYDSHSTRSSPLWRSSCWPDSAFLGADAEDDEFRESGADISDPRPGVTRYLRSLATQKLFAGLIDQLRQSYTITQVSVGRNAPTNSSTTVLATVEGKTITENELFERLKPYVYKVQLEKYELEMRAVDQTINDILLKRKANRLNVSPEALIRAAVDDKLHKPTGAEIQKYYEDNDMIEEAYLKNSSTDRLIEYKLENEQRHSLESEFVARLRLGSKIQFFLKQPQPPTLSISTVDSPSRGDINAPVTIVEFIDFHCSACAAFHPVIEEIMRPYGNRVRLVVRNFPLTADSRKAAEAAAAAGAQGRFFEYVAILLKNQSALDVASLKKYATDLELDRTRFEAALDTGQYAEKVNRDINDAEAYGIDGTPTIFINGIMLQVTSRQAMNAAIVRALTLKNTRR